MSESSRASWAPVVGALIAATAYLSWCAAFVREVVWRPPPGCEVQIRGGVVSVRVCGPFEGRKYRYLKSFNCPTPPD